MKKTDNQKSTIMRISDLTKIYPGIIAVNSISMDIKLGEVHGIIGKNGAGKTTLVSILSGVTEPTKGEIWVDGKKYSQLSRVKAKRLGVNIVPQEPTVVPKSTIAEMLISPDYIRNKNGLINWKGINLKAKEILDKAGLKIDCSTLMEDIPISLQQLLAIIKNFYIEESKVVVLDESSASLSESDREILFNIIEKEKKRCGILYISHRTDEILRVCDVLTVLRDGKAVVTDRLENMDEQKISAYVVGEGGSKRYRESAQMLKGETEKEIGDEVFSCKDLCCLGKLKDVSFSVRKGEIVGLAGLRGSGRTEIMKAIAGIDPPHSGVITINGQVENFTKPYQALKKRVAYLPEDREQEGVLSVLSVRHNISLLRLNTLKSRSGLIGLKKENDLAEDMIRRFDIKCVDREQEVKLLSGGNKQKVVFAKLFTTSPQLYLLDEPTKGIDILTKMEILALIKNDLIKNFGVNFQFSRFGRFNDDL